MPRFATKEDGPNLRQRLRAWCDLVMTNCGWLFLGIAMSAMASLYLVVKYDNQLEQRLEEQEVLIERLVIEVRNPELAAEIWP